MGWAGYEADRELRAEIGQDLLCGEFFIPPMMWEHRKTHHKHLPAWIKLMEKNPFYIFDVAQDAWAGVDFILSFARKVEALV